MSAFQHLDHASHMFDSPIAGQHKTVRGSSSLVQPVNETLR